MAEVVSVHRKKLPRTLMTHLSANPPTDSVSERRYLCDALRIDLVGPRPGDAALQRERLPQAPSRWYLTGFLAPGDAPEEQLAQDSEEALDEPAEPLHGSDDASTPDRGSHKRLFLPSSMGLSLLVDEETNRLDVAVSWGDVDRIRSQVVPPLVYGSSVEPILHTSSPTPIFRPGSTSYQLTSSSSNLPDRFPSASISITRSGISSRLLQNAIPCGIVHPSSPHHCLSLNFRHPGHTPHFRAACA